MSLELNPSDLLVFSKPSKDLTKTTLKATNKNAFPVGFKVKTTAPRLYCVRPNAGTILPMETLVIQVLVQPLKDEQFPADHFSKCRDKFLVQSIELHPNEIEMSPTDLWPLVESNRKDAIQEQKLRCAFMSPNASEVSPMDSSSPITGVTPAMPTNIVSSSVENPLVSPVTLQIPMNATGSFLRNEQVTQHPVKQAVDPSTWEKEKHEYTEEIGRLKKQLLSTSKESSGPIVHTIVNPNLYSPQFVFVVALLSFIIGAWLY